MMNIKKIVLVVVLGLGTVSNVWAMQKKESSTSGFGEGGDFAARGPRAEIPRLMDGSERLFHGKAQVLSALIQEYAVAGAPEIGKILAVLTQQEKKFVELAKAFTEKRTAIVARHKAAAAEDLANYKLQSKSKHNELKK